MCSSGHVPVFPHAASRILRCMLSGICLPHVLPGLLTALCARKLVLLGHVPVFSYVASLYPPGACFLEYVFHMSCSVC